MVNRRSVDCDFRTILRGLGLLLIIILTMNISLYKSERLTRNRVANKVPCPKSVSNCSCSSQTVGRIAVNCELKRYYDIPRDLDHQIIQLIFDKNKITSLPKGCLAGAVNLQLFSIATNHITAAHMDPSVFDGLTYLKRLNLMGNPIAKLRPNMFAALTSLNELNLSNTSLKYAPYNAFNNLKSLTRLYLASNDLLSFPLFVDAVNVSVVPVLGYLNLNKNQIPFIPFDRLNLLPNLHDLYLDGNGIRDLPNNSFTLLPKLKKLSLARNNFYEGVSVSLMAFSSDSLTDINIQDTKLHVSQARRQLFQYAPQLKSLTMARSKIDMDLKDVFQNLSRLNTLDVSGTGIVPDMNTFINSGNITFLSLNDLGIDLLDSRIFDNLYNLTSLHLQNNRIKVINFTSLPQWLWSNLTEIDVSKNQYICNCDIVWFRNHLLKNNTKLRFMYNKTYVCSTPLDLLNRKIMTLPFSFVSKCISSPTDWWLVTVFLLDLTLCLLFLILALVYRNRWNLRYLHFVFKSRRNQYRAEQDSTHYTYDAFVIYSQADMSWVVHDLLEHLERDDNLRLCIHHRDWLAGRDITDNILESIEASRKCLLIVSNAFLFSQWCHFEMTMAQTKLFEEDRDNLVLVVVEEIDDSNLSPRLRLQMQRQTYIEWTENVVGQQLFWARLRQALRRPDESFVHSSLPQNMFIDLNNGET